MATAVASQRALARAASHPFARIALSVAAALTFVAWEAHLYMGAWSTIHRRAFAQGYRSAHGAELRWVATQLTPDVCLFVGLAGAGLILALIGFRVWWALPTTLFVLVPVAGLGHSLQVIGHGWYYVQDATPAPWFATTWVAATFDLVLALLPGAAWVGVSPGRPRRSIAPTDVLSAAVVSALVAVVLRTSLVVSNHVPSVAVTTSVGAFALLASTKRPWWPWAAPAVALLVGEFAGDLLAYLTGGRPILFDLRVAAGGSVAVVTCGLVLSCWEPLSGAMRRCEESPVALLVAVNVLNVADALFTEFAVRAGQATELDPLVRSIGLPAKIVGVGLLSWLLYRKRPALLVIPAAVLLVVLAYHVSGLVIDT